MSSTTAQDDPLRLSYFRICQTGCRCTLQRFIQNFNIIWTPHKQISHFKWHFTLSWDCVDCISVTNFTKYQVKWFQDTFAIKVVYKQTEITCGPFYIYTSFPNDILVTLFIFLLCQTFLFFEQRLTLVTYCRTWNRKKWTVT